ncbi:MAG: hypothetical protein ACI4I6_06900 [Hominimerdicola sp.]
MKMRSLVTGVTMGIAAGTVVYAISGSSSREKRRLKTRTGKALHAMGDVIDGISVMMK